MAELAGVSIKTVSRVLNHEPKVRPATKERVLEAMSVLDYSPNSSARRLAGRRAYLLGMLYDNPGMSYITHIQNGALEACRHDHYDILIFPSNFGDPDLPGRINEMLSSVRVDGVLLTPPICDMDSIRAELRSLKAPNVVVSPGGDIGQRWAVLTNDREICSKMVHHLAHHRHRRIAFVKGDPKHEALDKRFQGFLDGMSACAIEVDTELCVQGFNNFESGIEAGKHLLNMNKPPTAIFCATDDMAAGVMLVAHQKGLLIPSDLSVTGFDDAPVARQTWPPLTTIRQPLHAMGNAAATLLIERIRGESGDKPVRVLDSELIIRDSSGRVPAPKY